jgi:glycosyltransferase involved in cell wall biosynthesis
MGNKEQGQTSKKEALRKKMDCSVVVPLYNEEENVEILYREISRVMESMGEEYEIIFIDDGSSDNTFQRLRELADKDPNMVIIKFRGNFGQSAAMSAGFEQAVGDVIVSLDGDLQNDPADIPGLIKKLREGHDVVSGWRKHRKDKMLIRKVPSKLANKIICHVTGVKLHDTGCSLKAYKKEVMKAISLYGELHRFIPALARMQGANIVEMAVNHRERKYGESKYNLTRTFKVLMDISTMNLFLKYFDRPQIYFGMAGIIFIITGLFTFIWLAVEWMVLGAEPGEQNIILTLTFLQTITGFQFILYGLISKLIVHTGKKNHNIPQNLTENNP